MLCCQRNAVQKALHCLKPLFISVLLAWLKLETLVIDLDAGFSWKSGFKVLGLVLGLMESEF